MTDKLTLTLSLFYLTDYRNSYFTFVFAMAFNAVREIIGPKLTLKSYLIFRLLVPVVVYAWLSLNLAMVSAPSTLPCMVLTVYRRRADQPSVQGAV